MSEMWQKLVSKHSFLWFAQVVDLEHGVLMNQDGQVLQDSQGKPKRVVLGDDGSTLFGNILLSFLNSI